MAEHEQIDFEDELRRYHRADPFVPFDIVVTSGDRYEVTQYDQVAFGGNTVVVVPSQKRNPIFRKNQIVAVHVHEPSA